MLNRVGAQEDITPIKEVLVLNINIKMYTIITVIVMLVLDIVVSLIGIRSIVQDMFITGVLMVGTQSGKKVVFGTALGVDGISVNIAGL